MRFGTAQLSVYRDLGLLSCRSIEISDCSAVGVLRFRTAQLSVYWDFGLLSCWSREISDYWAVGVGVLGFRTGELWEYRDFGLLSYRSTEISDRWAVGVLNCQSNWRDCGILRTLRREYLCWILFSSAVKKISSIIIEKKQVHKIVTFAPPQMSNFRGWI